MKNFLITKRRTLPFPKFKPKPRLITIFLSIAMLVAQAETYSQQTRITLNLENIPVAEVIDAIESMTDLRFVYKIQDVDINRTVSINVNKAPINTVLEKLFDQTRTTYKVMDLQVILSKEDNTQDTFEEEAVPSPDPIRVSGKVTNETGLPLPGVSIFVKGTTQGVASDVDGNYALEVPGPESVLVFTSIGFSDQEITVGNQTIIDVILYETIGELKEVVVSTGYYQTAARVATGNIAKVTSEEIERQPVINPLQALQGRVAGVQIQDETGIPGGRVNINIRGVNSLNNGQRLDNGITLPNANVPFFVIDGVPFTNTSVNSDFLPLRGGNPLANIRPSDIESIEILKDADATAIYGSRGANGVILITTKKGKSGRTALELNFARGFGEVPNKMELLNTEQYLEMRWEALRNDNETPTEALYPDLLVWDTTRFTDWQEELIGGVADQTNFGISLSGGSESTTFLLRGNYIRQGNVFTADNSAFQSGSGVFNLNHTSADNRFNIVFSANYTFSFNNQNGTDLTGIAMRLPPNAPALYDESGNLNWESSTWDNPLAGLRQEYENRSKNLVLNTTFSYQLLNNLKFRASLGYTNVLTDEIRIRPSTVWDPNIGGVRGSTFANSNSETWITEPQLEYQKQILKGTLSVIVGSSLQGSVTELESLNASRFGNDALIRDISSAERISDNPSSYAEYRYTSIYGRINYNREDKYMLNFTARRDGSSRFGPGRRFGNFGALGAAWVFSEEDFVNIALPFVSFGKLRASYGLVGNDAIGDYQYLNSFNATQPYNQEPSLIPSRAANPDYSWESTRKLEFGLDLGWLKNRILLNTSWYRHRTSDQLIGRPIPGTTGFNTIQFNLPAVVENRGWEFELSTVNVRAGAFQWRTALNLTLPKNELLEFPDIEEFPEFDALYEVGQPILGRKQYQLSGVNPETGEYDFVDYNNDGFINIQDRQNFVPDVQKYFGGINNSFSYKGLQLDVFFQFQQQGALPLTNSFGLPGASRASNFPLVVLNRWQNAGDNTNTQRFSRRLLTPQSLYHRSSRINASFVRLENVSLSWNLPIKLLNAVKMQNARIFVQGQNLLTFTPYDGLDPETRSLQLPPLRIITSGVQLTF